MRQSFVLTGVDSCQGYRFAFLLHNTSAICELSESLFHHCGITLLGPLNLPALASSLCGGWFQEGEFQEERNGSYQTF